MKKFFTILTGLLLLQSAQHLFAQQKQIIGKVLGENNTPIEGVSVVLQGTKKGTQTNANGVFTIAAKKGDVLEISAVSYVSQKVKIGNETNLSVILVPGENVLSEVTVVMDQKRNPRELGYSVQTVSGKAIAETQRENFVNSLQGRVSGVTVTPTTGTAGASSGIILRGYNTLSGSNQPLFVVDGIIVDNSTLNTNSYSRSGIGLASDLSNTNVDYTNRIADLNPNDIESVTVLKGPEATALYGSQASSGAIVITTKKAKGTNGKILVTYDDNFRLQWINRFAKVNNDYGPGYENNIPAVPPDFPSFGSAWEPGTPLFDNIHHFFKTGFSQTHNIGLEFGTNNVGFRFSGQYFDDNGAVPNNTYKKYNFKLSNNTKIGKYITITPSIAYIKADNIKPLKGSLDDGGFTLDLYSWPANNDIRNYQTANGGKLLLFNPVYNGDYDNPIWDTKNNTSGDFTNRWIGTLGIDINPFSWLSLSGRFGYDTYKTDGYLFNHPESYILDSHTYGTLDNYYRKYTGYNHTISATLKRNFGAFSTRLLAGTMWQDFETKQFGVVGSQLIDSVGIDGNMYKNGAIVTGFNYKDSSITLPDSRIRLLRNYEGLPNELIFRELAYFAEASIGYKNEIFLTYSHRFESASPIPKANRNYNYPGASISVIVSDILPFLKKGNVLDFLKLRASFASTARLNDPYSNQSFFVTNLSSSAVFPAYTYGFTNADENLRPERQKTYEVGTEMRFLNDKISLEAAYYNTLCLDQISQGYRASYATGYILNTTNASSLRNEGIEITLNITPISKPNFNWTVNFNFSHMWSKVLTLPASIAPDKDFYNSNTYISNVRGGLIRGHSTGTITGSIYERDTITHQILIDPSTGIPLVDYQNHLIGDRTPDFTLGTLNTFRYKNWSLSFLWDLKAGGDIYNGTEETLTNLGKSERTANRSTPILIPGILADGLENTKTPTKNTLVIIPKYLSDYYYSLPDEEFIQHNVNWFRLRDITLSYRLPDKTIQKIKAIKGLSFFVTGNDLVLLTNYYGADPAVNSNNPASVGVGGYGFDLGNTPTPISLSFGLHANF